MSVVLRGSGTNGNGWTPLASIAAGVAVAEAIEQSLSSEAIAGARVELKWPNDVLLGDCKVAGILLEGRPQEGWAVLGIGVNVVGGPDALPSELVGLATTLELESSAIERLRLDVLAALGMWLEDTPAQMLDAYRRRDALLGRPVAWDGGQGTARGVDERGRLLVETAGGAEALDAGEVHLAAA